jgi:hypothetical protein
MLAIKVRLSVPDKLPDMKSDSWGASSPDTTARERRSGTDRRAPASFPPSFSSQRRRRSCGRRDTDRGGYVDIYDRRSWVLALVVLALSFLDAILTVLQIEKGLVREANPIMNLVLTWGGVYAFFSLKAAMTAFALAIIMIHKEWVLARYVARVCLGCYLLILCYHLYLVGTHGGVIPTV